MKCARVSSLMSDYLDEGLPGSVMLEFEEHVRGCRECYEALEETRQVVIQLGSLSQSGTGIDCWPGVRAAIVAEEVRARSWFERFARPLVWGPAFALTLLVAIWVLMPIRGQRDVHVQGSPASEYSAYLSAHSSLQQRHALNDPDVAFITAEIENASYSGDSVGR